MYLDVDFCTDLRHNRSMATKRKRVKRKLGGKHHIEKKAYVQIRFFEEMFIVKSPEGEVLYTGSEETAEKVLKLLNKKRGRK